MGITDKLNNLLQHQKKITSELEKELSNLNSDELYIENNSLKRKLNEVISDNSKLHDENKKLKNSLYQKLYNDKMSVLNLANRKADIYFQSSISGEVNSLKEFEINSQKRTDSMIDVLKQNRLGNQTEIYNKFNELSSLINKKVTETRLEQQQQIKMFSQKKNEEYNKLKQEPLQDNEIQNALKKSNLESLFGLNIANIIGIFFLISGFIAGFKFTYLWLPDVAKSISTFVAGIILLIVGEVLNRKKPNVFSLGITSGGVGVSYAAVAFSYFGLHLLNMYLALTICILITALSFGLSQRYKSQTIATFALVGGYLPLFAISQSRVLVYSSMIYFIILNIFALLTACRKKWSVTSTIGVLLNVIGTTSIMDFTIEGNGGHLSAKNVIGLIYIFFAFAIYTIIPILSTYVTKIKLKKIDIVILGFNTFISTVYLFGSFYDIKLNDFNGLLAVIFAVTYIFLGRFVDKKLKNEKSMAKLFYITGLTFVILIVPFQFDKVWLSLGWLIEGILVVTYGILTEKKNFKLYGYIINSICLLAFILVDVSSAIEGYNDMFVYQYSLITLGTLIIMASYIYKKMLVKPEALALKYGTSINIWFYMLYIIKVKFSEVLTDVLRDSSFSYRYITSALCIIIGLVIVYALRRIKDFVDLGIRIISISIFSISILWLLILNSSNSLITESKVPIVISLVGTIVLILVNLISVFSIIDFVHGLDLDRKFSFEWYSLIVSAYVLFIVTQNLITQYNLSFSSSIISIVYVVTALSLIIIGFVKRHSLIRIFGLGLSYMAIAKLFVLDLSFLTQGLRIISYFAFGIALISISFVYQYFNKRIEVTND